MHQCQKAISTTRKISELDAHDHAGKSMRVVGTMAHSPAIVGLAGGTIPTDRLEKTTVQIAAPIAAPIRGASQNSQS
jgi:hypothetical protein